MTLKKLTILCVGLCAFFSLMGRISSSAQSTEPFDDDEDINDTQVRENPIIENDDEIGITVPDFINLNSNKIELNGANWESVRRGILNCRNRPFSIVHIGDSHLQADIGTGVVRELLQYDYGNAGRGLVAPLKMAGTNEPYDYVMKAESGSWKSAKLLKRPWILPMGFTGVSVAPASGYGEFYVATSEKDDYNPFISLTIYGTGDISVKSVKSQDGEELKYNVGYTSNRAIIKLAKEESGVTVGVEAGEDAAIFGVSLSGERPGVFYNVIGNNGATYQSYNNIADFNACVRQLNPGLIIVSLGTNEAFGTFDSSTFKAQMKQFVSKIKSANPNVPILLTTPMECQRSVYSTASRNVTSKKKNKRGRTESYRVHGYGVNTNVNKVREAILEFGKENNIATYDWFEVAGGDGASTIWMDEGMFGRDRLHHTAKGYRLQGYMLYEALKPMFESLNK